MLLLPFFKIYFLVTLVPSSFLLQTLYRKQIEVLNILFLYTLLLLDEGRIVIIYCKTCAVLSELYREEIVEDVESFINDSIQLCETIRAQEVFFWEKMCDVCF